MKNLFYCLSIFALTHFTAANAQTLNVSFETGFTQLQAGDELNATITVATSSSFQASVFLTLKSSTLPLTNNNLSNSIVNAPFPQTVLLTYKSTLLDSGIHTVIIEGKNGNLSSYDTLTIEIGRSEQWRKLGSAYNGILNYYFSKENILHFNSGWSSVSKIVAGEIIMIPGWENLTNQHNTLFIDRENNIWTSTASGIGKFDGEYWTVFPFTGYNRVSKILEDKNGVIWFYSYSSKAHFTDYSLYRLENGVIEKINEFRSLVSGLSNPNTTFRIFDMCSDFEGNIFALVCPQSDSLLRPTLLKFNGETWSAIDYPNVGKTNIDYMSNWMRITSDYLGNLWFWYDVMDSTKKDVNGLLKFDGNTWSNFKATNDYQIPGEGGTSTAGIHADKAGNLWFPSYVQNWSLIQFNGSDYRQYNSINSPLPFNTPSSIGIDSNNNVWMRCDSNTIVYNPNGIIGVKAATSIADNQNYFDNFKTIASPNPTQNSTTIHYSLKTESPVSISIYNTLGIEVFKNNLGFKNAGDNSEIISTSELPSGQYYYVLKAGAQQSTQPLVIVR